MFDIYMFEKATGLKICKTIHNFNPIVGEKNALSPFLTPAETKISVVLSASVKRFGSPICRIFFELRDFLNLQKKVFSQPFPCKKKLL